MSHEGAETFEDLMIAVDLRQLLRTKTAEEFRKRWEQSHPHPPILGVLVFGATGGVCYTINPDIGFVFFSIAGLLMSWYIISSAIRAANDMPKKLDMIERGEYPSDAIEVLAPRLRWWNQLLEPHRWARHSRIFELERRLETRIADLSKRIAEEEQHKQDALADSAPGDAAILSQSPTMATHTAPEDTDLTGEPQETSLPDGVLMNPLELAKQIVTLDQRLKYQDLLYKITDESLRKRANLVLMQAMLQRAQETTRILNRIKQLRVDLQVFPKITLTKFIDDVMVILEERRRLVGIIDQIDPADRINLISI